MSTRLFKRGDRGFRSVGRPFSCTYGTRIDVYESSAAIGPRLWLNLKCNWTHEPSDTSAHLDRRQASLLVMKLQAWLRMTEPKPARPKRKARR